MPEALREIPEVFSLDVPFQFAESADDADEIPFELHARSAEGVPDYYYGAIYHDFAGMTVAESIPVDYCHDSKEVLGVANRAEVKADGLHLFGSLVRTAPGDRVDQLKKLRAKNVPFQASIDFRGYAKYEEIGRDQIATVNGQQITGPALIVRKWTLRGVAICPYGRDKNTDSQFSAATRPQTVEIFSEGKPMSKATMSAAAGTPETNSEAPKTPAAGTPQTLSEPTKTTTPEPANKPEQQFSIPADQRDLLTAAVKKYSEQFGAEKGLAYLTSGMTFEAAAVQHCNYLQEQLTAAHAENQQLNERLQALHTGEQVPGQQLGQQQHVPESGNEPDQRFAHMGKRGAFAAAIQFTK